MADNYNYKKINELTVATSIYNNDNFILLQSDGTKRITYNVLSTQLKNNCGINSIENTITRINQNLQANSETIVDLSNSIGNNNTGLVLSAKNFEKVIYADNGLTSKVNNLETTDISLFNNFNTLSAKIYGDNNYAWNIVTDDSLSARIYKLENDGLVVADVNKVGGFKTGFTEYTDTRYTYYPVSISSNGSKKDTAYVSIPRADDIGLLPSLINKVDLLINLSSSFNNHIMNNENNISTIQSELSIIAKFDEDVDLEDGYVLSHDVILDTIAKCDIKRDNNDNDNDNDNISVDLTGGFLYDLALSVNGISGYTNNLALSVNGISGYTNNLALSVSGISSSFYNNVYPINSVYFSVSNTNPSTLFGGTWSYIQTVLSANSISAWKRTS